MSTRPGASPQPPASTVSRAAPRSAPRRSPLSAAMRPSLTPRLPSRAGAPRPSMMRAFVTVKSSMGWRSSRGERYAPSRGASRAGGAGRRGSDHAARPEIGEGVASEPQARAVDLLVVRAGLVRPGCVVAPRGDGELRHDAGHAHEGAERAGGTHDVVAGGDLGVREEGGHAVPRGGGPPGPLEAATRA